jgi:hypothetical protein
MKSIAQTLNLKTALLFSEFNSLFVRQSFS